MSRVTPSDPLAGQLDGLGASFRGQVITPGDDDYDEARQVWNGAIDRRPRLIVLPADDDDVSAAVTFAATHDLQVSVRGGGHNVAGSALCDGLVVDLRNMRTVSVDPKARRARVQGGATWLDADAATQQHDLVIPGGIVSDTGVGGLTLGGGMGWLRRAYGLSCDQVTGFELVLADGSRILADANQHSDLYRALRGGGTAPGVVTTFEFALHPLEPEVLFTFVAYPAEDGMDVIRAYREFTGTAPEDLTTSLLLGLIPAAAPYPESLWGRRYVAVAGMYAGDAASGASAIAPLLRISDKTPMLDTTAVQPYSAVQQTFDAAYPHGSHYYWTSAFFQELSDDVAQHMLGWAAKSTSPRSMLAAWHLGGALRREPAGGSA